jgi:hypothetical protein
VWNATVESIQEKLTRCRQTLEQIKPGCTSPKSRKQKKCAYSGEGEQHSGVKPNRIPGRSRTAIGA